MNNHIKLFLIEDNKLIQAGLKSILDSSTDIQIVGQSTNIDEILESFSSIEIEVVLLDINNKGIIGLDLIPKLLEINNSLKIIVISEDNTKENIIKALSLGIYAYVFKDINTDILISIIKSVHNGAMWLAPKVVEYLREDKNIQLPSKKMSKNNFKATHSDLTQREYEVLKLIVDGKSNNEIAAILCISEHTAKAHVCNIIQKLVVDDRTQAAVKALKDGLV